MFSILIFASYYQTFYASIDYDNAMRNYAYNYDLSKIINQIEGIKTSDGAGVSLTRIIGSPELNMLDPFLLLDEFGSDNPDDYIAGFPSHPHRGFETITYMLNGKFHHKDNAGNEGFLEDGSVQWMTAGKGVIHSEMPKQTNGLVRGFQLWLNLPKEKKNDRTSIPRYFSGSNPMHKN